MKQLLIALALVMVLTPMMIFFSDSGMTSLANRQAKRDAEKAVGGAVNYHDLEEYAEGRFVFRDADCIAFVNDAVGAGYFYTIYLFDESEKMRAYTNDSPDKEVIEISTDDFAFPYSFTDKTGEIVIIEYPSAIIVLERPDITYYRLSGLELDSVVRSSMYVVEGRWR